MTQEERQKHIEELYEQIRDAYKFAMKDDLFAKSIRTMSDAVSVVGYIGYTRETTDRLVEIMSNDNEMYNAISTLCRFYEMISLSRRTWIEKMTSELEDEENRYYKSISEQEE